MVFHYGEYTMEESSPPNVNGQIGQSSTNVNSNNNNSNNNSNNNNTTNNKPNEEQRPQYTIPGILHYIQHEWAKFEMERSQWEVHKAELEAKIAFLQGERKGQDNLKNDLIRRIKMLEFALKQERAKYHKLKYGTELNQGDMNPPVFDERATSVDISLDTEGPFTSVNNITWKQGRSLLRQYLQEIGYADTIIDVRSNKVKMLLGITNDNNDIANVDEEGTSQTQNSLDTSNNKRSSESQGKRNAKKTLADSMILDPESAVMANFKFLTGEGDVDMDDDEEEEDDDMTVEIPDETTPVLSSQNASSKFKISRAVMMTDIDDVDAEAEDVLNELHLLSENEDINTTDIRNQGSSMFSVPPSRSSMPNVSEEEGGDSSLGLGELAELTVNNDTEGTYEMTSKEPCRKTWNAKYTLRSHFDGVRALAFHPVEPVLITASEDRTLKLWNLHKTVTTKKSVSLDVEPLYTFRKHLSPVLCVSINETGEKCYSGCLDGHIYCWNIPSANIDPYDAYEPGVLACSLDGHTDAIWCLSLHSQKPQLLSCSADGTVKLWTPSEPSPLLSTYSTDPVDGVPTSADFVRNEMNHIVVSYTSGACVVYDIETTQPVLKFEQPSDNSPYEQINKLLCHPTLPLTITAHEDRHIRFLDNTTGKIVHWMVAHLDSVTSLAVDPNGLFLLSGSHDCSIRLWNLDTKTCIQEMTAHRKKFDESIYDVAFHPSKPYIASSGADGLAKVFV